MSWPGFALIIFHNGQMSCVISEVAVGKAFNLAPMFRRKVCVGLKAECAVGEILVGDARNHS